MSDKLVEQFYDKFQLAEKCELTLPVPVSEFADRVKRCQKEAAKHLLDGLLVCGRPMVKYLTNYSTYRPAWPPVFKMMGRGSAILVVPTDGEATLIIDFYYTRELVTTEDLRMGKDVISNVADVIAEKKIDRGNLGIAGAGQMLASNYLGLVRRLPQASICTSDDIVDNIRVIKSPAEQEHLRQAAKIGDHAMEVGMAAVAEGKREFDVAKVIMDAMYDADGDTEVPLVQSGPRWSAIPSRESPNASNRKLRTGDMVLIDIHGGYKGYDCDLTRTTVVGQPDQRQRELLEMGKHATELEIASCRPGVKAEDLEKATIEFYGKKGYGQYHTMTSGGPMSCVGHGIGLGVDKPILVDGDKTVLEQGMALAIEPGVYLPGIGGVRIEDDIIVTDSGCEVLNKVSRIWW